jgi:predicted RNA polymerase sigma factor
MELSASRTAARIDTAGEPILMLDQNRSLWDQFQIRRGMQALGRVRELGGAGGVYALQAAIIACHAQARTARETDRSRISGLYAELAAIVRSPILDLNRAVAVGMAEGPEAALAIVNLLVREAALKGYTCCQAFEATCSTSSAATRKRAPNSQRPRHWRATGANMTC